MDSDALRDDQWERLKGLVPGGTKGKRGPRANNRRFLDALLWMARSGGRRRDLPERFGNHHSVKRRLHRLRSSLKSSRLAISRYTTRTKMPNRLRSGPRSGSG